jgi:hypothetical protein
VIPPPHVGLHPNILQHHVTPCGPTPLGRPQ